MALAPVYITRQPGPPRSRSPFGKRPGSVKGIRNKNQKLESRCQLPIISNRPWPNCLEPGHFETVDYEQ